LLKGAAMKHAWLAAFSLAMLTTGCAVEEQRSTDESTSNDEALTSWAMPKAIIQYESAGQWGTMHLRWHTERQWNLLDPSDRAWAQKQGWSATPIQEGQAGNGLEFLAMHRMMIQMLVAKFPSDKSLFTGWTAIPTKPGDKTAPTTSEAFDPDMQKAIDTLDNHIDQFASDDAFGLYIETTLRPTSKNPDGRTTDATAGIHNYIHNRFANSSSSIDLGDPTKNLGNKVFWRLHGWIDARWTAFRAAKGLKDTDPTYVAAMQKAHNDMMMGMKVGGAYGATDDTPPESLTKFFENEAQQ
jgi:hypothetical protein